MNTKVKNIKNFQETPFTLGKLILLNVLDIERLTKLICLDNAYTNWCIEKNTFLYPLIMTSDDIMILFKHLSSKHLSSIINGELKDNDDIYIECEAVSNSYDIKLSDTNHITLLEKSSDINDNITIEHFGLYGKGIYTN